MKHRKTILLFLLLALIGKGFTQSAPSDTSKPLEFYFVDDDPIAAMLDSLIELKFFKINSSVVFSDSYEDTAPIPIFDDEICIQRIATLNEYSPFNFVYNEDVKNYIDLYSRRRKGLTARMMGLAHLYFPVFEEMLDKYDIPIEMKYLAIIESALNPIAKSRAGAMGLWQFMPQTGAMYKLEINNFVDDRCDPYKSTDAACRHLLDLYRVYKDWFLVLAAYNAGSGNVNRAIARSGGKTSYWEVRPFLPRETQNYVPAFIAVNYVMAYAEELNIIPVEPFITNHEIDTVLLNNPISFDQLNGVLGISKEHLHALNPGFKKPYIPASHSKPYVLRMPKEHIAAFENNKDVLFAYKTEAQLKLEEELIRNKSIVYNSGQNIHSVKKGESLGLIANRYNCSVEELKKWNKINNSTIHPGQQLIIHNNGKKL